ncbi:hypothetical protein LY78DRAFT_499552 [Colletotrichum sublineola]|nr:hypothetical protein LY78DRAFT_499552 [Colletotrichum sublineola]
MPLNLPLLPPDAQRPWSLPHVIDFAHILGTSHVRTQVDHGTPKLSFNANLEVRSFCSRYFSFLHNSSFLSGFSIFPSLYIDAKGRGNEENYFTAFHATESSIDVLLSRVLPGGLGQKKKNKGWFVVCFFSVTKPLRMNLCYWFGVAATARSLRESAAAQHRYF